jgi:hypothetical protein
MKEELQNRARETKIIHNLRHEEEKELNLIKDEIRKMNKKISDINV